VPYWDSNQLILLEFLILEDLQSRLEWWSPHPSNRHHFMWQGILKEPRAPRLRGSFCEIAALLCGVLPIGRPKPPRKVVHSPAYKSCCEHRDEHGQKGCHLPTSLVPAPMSAVTTVGLTRKSSTKKSA